MFAGAARPADRERDIGHAQGRRLFDRCEYLQAQVHGGTPLRFVQARAADFEPVVEASRRRERFRIHVLARCQFDDNALLQKIAQHVAGFAHFDANSAIAGRSGLGGEQRQNGKSDPTQGATLRKK